MILILILQLQTLTYCGRILRFLSMCILNILKAPEFELRLELLLKRSYNLTESLYFKYICYIFYLLFIFNKIYLAFFAIILFIM